MTWLDERVAELRQAEGEIPQLYQSILQTDQTLASLRRELNNLPHTSTNEPTLRRQQLCTEISEAIYSRSNLSGRLHHAERAVYVLPELVNRKNHMDPRTFPPEIREMILSLVLVKDDPIKLDDCLYPKNLGLLQTCKQMQREGRAIYYGDNTFEATLEHYSRLRWDFNLSPRPEEPRIQALQKLTIYTGIKTDIPGLILLVKGCISLERLVIIIEDAPEDYEEHWAREVTSLQYERPSKLDLISVEIPSAQADPEAESIRKILLDIL
ncbi:hypothetical protein OIDMADRAFT_36046 [Oidiodendron maius Zn]|uniref:Uncharacterized protein n=1 Tax=Oidiodendron maius (strain Zn) TaxID=913774 RepID=A0A0C3C2L6_OIDMZ|nr:hypothetical protein OIDMADRAFT_36046 [Oidiodendron maius Zn]